MKQISIMCKDSTAVTELTELLSLNDFDIRDLSFLQLGANAVINLMVDDYDRCLSLLAANAYTAVSDETLLIRLQDRPGALAEVSRKISNENVEIRSLTLVSVVDSDGIVAINTSNNKLVRQLYQEKLIN